MTETPDFEQIARVAVTTFYGTAPRHSADERQSVANIAEQLRLIWNARGAVDSVRVESELTAMMGGTAIGPYLTNLDRALRSLDR